MRTQKNVEVRQAAKDAGIKLWEIAERLGCADATLSRKLRRELQADERNVIMEIIHHLAEENQGVE